MRGTAVAIPAGMNTIRILSLISLCGLAACSKRDPIGINLASAASNTTVTSAAAPTPTVPAIADGLDPCDKDDKPFKPELANIGFEWSESPSLSDAPTDGVYMQIGSGPVMKAEETEIWVDKKRGSFDLRVKTGGPGLGPSIHREVAATQRAHVRRQIRIEQRLLPSSEEGRDGELLQADHELQRPERAHREDHEVRRGEEDRGRLVRDDVERGLRREAHVLGGGNVQERARGRLR